MAYPRGDKHWRYKDGRMKPCSVCRKIIRSPYPRMCRDCYVKSLMGKKKEGFENNGRTRFKKGITPWNKGMKGFLSGESHYNWKGGVTKILYRRMRRRILREIGGYTIEKINSVLSSVSEKYGKIVCTYCLKELNKKEIIIEHKTPLSRGGNNDFDNLTTACRSCNSSKGNKTVEEWRVCKK